MKVSELIDLLETVDPDKIVVMSSDSEGNYYHELLDFDGDVVFDSREGEIGYSQLTEELIKDGYGEEDLIEDGVSAVCFWP